MKQHVIHNKNMPHKNRYKPAAPDLRKSIKTAKIFLITLLVVTTGCGGGQKKPGNARIITVSSDRLSLSRDAIDNYRTHEIFFTLEKKINCISIQVSAEYFPYEFAESKKIAQTFFIVERLVTSVAKQKDDSTVYTELGKNFTTRWNRRRKITICASPRLPLKKLDGQSLYRLRITTFHPGTFDFTITINSDHKVIYYLTEKDAPKQHSTTR